MPQHEVVPAFQDTARIEEEMWKQRMPGLKQALLEVPEEDRGKFMTLSSFANSWMDAKHKKAV